MQVYFLVGSAGICIQVQRGELLIPVPCSESPAARCSSECVTQLLGVTSVPGAELLLPFMLRINWEYRLLRGANLQGKLSKGNLDSLLFLLILLAGAKPAASVDPWAAPAGSTAQPLSKNVDPWAPAQPSSTAAKSSVDPWGSAPANKPLSTSGEQRSHPISVLFE